MDLMSNLGLAEVPAVPRAGMTRTANALTEVAQAVNVKAQAVLVVPAVDAEVRAVFLDLANHHRHPIRSILGR